MVESNAALEAREAKVQIQSHIAECARRYKETAEALADIRATSLRCLSRLLWRGGAVP